MSTSLKPLIIEFDRAISDLREADIGRIPEIERTKAIQILEGAQSVVRALCLTRAGRDSDFPPLASFLDDGE